MNAPKRLIDRFLVLSGDGKVQPDADTGILNADLTTRDACTITMEEVVLRDQVRDCKGRDLVDEIVRTRGLRFTFAYSEVTPQILARWAAYFLGAATAPTGTPADEVQTLSRTGTVSGGSFTASMTLEGITAQSKAIPWNATTTQLRNALTEGWMGFIQPGDIAVTGDWTAGMVVTFGGRLRKADLPLFTLSSAGITGGGSVAIAQTTPGEQNFHEFSRSTDDTKQRFSFCLGWDDVTDRVEKYVGFICESISPSLQRRQSGAFTVSVVGPWTPEILTSFSIPDCESVDFLRSEDCRVEIDSSWETSDVNQETYTLNDNVPLDENTAYPFVGVDITRLERGDQPNYEITAGIFGSEKDNIYQLALNERTQDPVDYRTHFGMPGNRFTLISENTKIKFQNNRLATAGSLNESVVQITGTPYKLDTTLPVSAEAYLDQATAFLLTSE